MLLIYILAVVPAVCSAGKKQKKSVKKEKPKKEIVEVRSVKPYIVFTGVSNVRIPRSCRKIVSGNEWAKLWLQNEGLPIEQEEYDYYYNTSRVPEIDFSNCMVIAIYEFKGALIHGLKFGGFNSIEVIEEKKNLVVHLSTKTFQTIERPDSLNGGEPASKTTLYSFFVIPRSTKKIMLQIDARSPEQRANNSPPVWKEYSHIEL
jgi:hypothetical protein